MVDTINLIPKTTNQTDILMQANLPELFPRPYNQSLPSIQPLIPGTAPFSQNITLLDVIRNSFPVQTQSGSWINLSIKYAIADPFSNFFTFGNPSMYTFLHLMLKSGKYGVVSEQSGIILLKRNYVGPLLKYVPMNQTYQASQLYYGAAIGYNSTYSNGVITGQDYAGGAVWGGPDTYLPPGQFRVTFTLMTTNNSKNNYMILEAQNSPSHLILSSKLITGAYFQNIGKWTNISIIVNSTNVEFPIQFNSWDTFWHGRISIFEIKEIQINVNAM